MSGNILLFFQLAVVLYSFYINFKNSGYMKKSNWFNSILCYVSLGLISNNIDNISTKAILTLIMFLILISELNTIKILKNNDTEIVVEKI